VADVVENELTQLATHMLPVAAMFERDAVTRNKVHSGFAQAVVSLRYRVWHDPLRLVRQL
jgi:hypothetical protein